MFLINRQSNECVVEGFGTYSEAGEQEGLAFPRCPSLQTGFFHYSAGHFIFKVILGSLR